MMNVNQILFVVGISITIISIVLLLVVQIVYKFKKLKLDSLLDEEYGKESHK